MADKEAVELAMNSAPFCPRQIFTSELPRCANLSHGLAKACSMPVYPDTRLREMNFGEWEGRTCDAIDAEDGPRWRQWCEN